MIKSGKGHGSRRSQNRDERIALILQEYNNHDTLTVMEFCKLHKIHKSTFYNWRNHYANKKIVANKSKGFLPVEVTTTSYGSVSTTPTLFAEVNGIRLFHYVSPDYLKALLP